MTEKIDQQKLANETLSVTAEQFIEYAKAKGMATHCESCGHEHWSHAEENGLASLVATPSIRSPGSANWYFTMVCLNCGNTRFINAGYVWSFYFEKVQLDG